MTTETAIDPAALLDRTRRYVCHIAHRWARRYRLDADDVTQATALLILERIDRYDPDRESPEWWAGSLTMRAVNNLIRQRDGNILGRAVPLPVTLGRDGAEVTVPDPRAEDPTAVVEAADLADAVQAAVAELSEQDRAAVLLRYRDRAAVSVRRAALGGVSKARADQIERRALARLREVMGGQDGP